MQTKRVHFDSLRDLPITAIARTSMEWNRTGQWRHLRPFYEEKLSPCTAGCPAGEDVRGFIRLLGEKNPQAAWELIKADNPFPGVCGNVCYHPCEGQCNRKDFDKAIAINALERYAYDHASRGKGFVLEGVRPRKERVAIVGSGPAGLACAYHTARLGYKVRVYEALAEPGGILRYGIPQYRLPRSVLDDEIRDIVALGVEIACGKKLGANLSLEELDRFDATFLATGAHLQASLGIPGEEHERVWRGLEFLRQVSEGALAGAGKEVAVIGGGNTAIDAARTVLRLGARPVMYYRRSRLEMPAHPDEVEEAEREGIQIEFLTAPVKVTPEQGRVRLECVRMELGAPDDSGRRRPIPIEDSNFIVTVDTVISAIGELCELSFIPPEVKIEKGIVLTDRWGHTGRCGTFAGGDLVQRERTVAHAIGTGKRAAVGIDCFLKGKKVELATWGTAPGAFSMAEYLAGGGQATESPKLVRPEDLNVDYFEPATRAEMPKLSKERRSSGFRQVNLGLPEESAMREAERCFLCGICTLCENCYIFCPEMSVRLNSDGRYQIDYDYCKGCGICVEECPRSAMSIAEERPR